MKGSSAAELGGPSLPPGRCAATSSIPGVAPGSAVQSLAAVVDEGVDREADLFGGVAVAHRHGPVLEALEVDGDAQRRPDLVLAPVAATDRLRLVVVAEVA